MTKRELIEIRHALRLLSQGIVEDKNSGICHNLHINGIRLRTFMTVLQEACKEWEYYSGSYYYPIETLSLKYHSYSNKWDEDSSDFAVREYARRRYELVNRMIKVVESKLSALN